MVITTATSPASTARRGRPELVAGVRDDGDGGARWSLSAPGRRGRRAGARRRRRRSRPLSRARSGGGAGQRDVGRLRISGESRSSSRRCAATVPASPRATGPVRAASPERRALSSAARQQRARGPGRGSSTPACAAPACACATSVTRWFGAVRERRVVARPVRLGDPHRLAAHLDDERLGHRPQDRVGAVTPKQQLGEPVEVHRGAGERHRRVQGQRQHVLRARRLEHGRPRAGRWCAPTICPACQAPVAASPRDEARAARRPGR